MSIGDGRFRWAVVADSVVGASHRRTGLPNQDAFDYAIGEAALRLLFLPFRMATAANSAFEAKSALRLPSKRRWNSVSDLLSLATTCRVWRLPPPLTYLHRS